MKSFYLNLIPFLPAFTLKKKKKQEIRLIWHLKATRAQRLSNNEMTAHLREDDKEQPIEGNGTGTGKRCPKYTHWSLCPSSPISLRQPSCFPIHVPLLCLSLKP
jgi:hypothetical protein